MTSRVALAAHCGEGAKDRRLLALAFVAGATSQRSRLLTAEPAPVAASAAGWFMTLLQRRPKRSRQTKKLLASEHDSHK